jgi:hypothetical protein
MKVKLIFYAELVCRSLLEDEHRGRGEVLMAGWVIYCFV